MVDIPRSAVTAFFREPAIAAALGATEEVLEAVWAGGYRTVSAELPNALAAAYARERAGTLITEVDGVTHERVLVAIRDLLGGTFENADVSEADLSAAIMAEFEGMAGWRADLIADTETAYAAGYGAVGAANEVGLEYAEISDGTENDEECASADGQIWTVEDYEANILEHPGCGRSASFLSADEVDPNEVTSP